MGTQLVWRPIADRLSLPLLRNLRALELQYISVDGPPAFWSTLTKLTKLEVAFTEHAIPEPVLGMSGLKELTSRGCFDPGRLLLLPERLPGLAKATLQMKLWECHHFGLLYQEEEELRKRLPALELVVHGLDWS